MSGGSIKLVYPRAFLWTRTNRVTAPRGLTTDETALPRGLPKPTDADAGREGGEVHPQILRQAHVTISFLYLIFF